MIDIDKAFENRWRIKQPTLIFDKDLLEYVKVICRDFFEAGIMIGQSEENEPQPKVTITVKTPLDIRAEEFCRSLNTTENNRKYGQQMLKDFYEYWSEPNTSHTKMRFELQKTWDVNRRLARWARNNFNRYDRQQPTLEQQRKSKLADILTD